MKNKFLSFIIAICLIIPCAFLVSGCGGKDKAVNLEGKTIVFDRVEDLEWEEGSAFHLIKVIDDEEYEVMLNTREFVEKFWNSEAFSRALGKTSKFNTLEEAKNALKTKAFEVYKEDFPSFKFSQDGASVTVYKYNDTTLANPIGTYQLTERNSEYGYGYEFFLVEGEVSIIHSEPDYIRLSTVLEGKSLFLTGFTNEVITMKSLSGNTRQVQLSEFNDNTENGFQFMYFINSKNYYKIVD